MKLDGYLTVKRLHTLSPKMMLRLAFRVGATLRNNDGVGIEWTNRDGEEEGIFEVDNSFRAQFQVGE